MMPPTRSEPPFHEMEWADDDGDRVRFTWDDTDLCSPRGRSGQRGSIQIFDSEDGSENAVYVDEEDARRIVAWLSERLRSV